MEDNLKVVRAELSTFKWASLIRSKCKWMWQTCLQMVKMGAMTFSITAFSMTTLSIMGWLTTISIITLSIQLVISSVVMPSVIMLSFLASKIGV